MEDRYLFRGKMIGVSCKWIVGDLYCFNGTVSIICGYESDGRYNTHIIPVFPETIGQCTGLTDKNGKLVFEGDIDDIGGIFVYKNYSIGRQYNDKFYSMNELDLSRQFEIIGNIYDRPDILGK